MNSRPVHSLMLSSNLFFCLPCPLCFHCALWDGSIYYVKSVPENDTFHVFATYTRLASKPNTDHHTDSHFSCKSKKISLNLCHFFHRNWQSPGMGIKMWLGPIFRPRSRGHSDSSVVQGQQPVWWFGGEGGTTPHSLKLKRKLCITTATGKLSLNLKWQ